MQEITGITSNEVAEVKEKTIVSMVDDIRYRMVYKEDKDMVDFTIISIIIGLMLIIMLILNKRKHYIH